MSKLEDDFDDDRCESRKRSKNIKKTAVHFCHPNCRVTDARRYTTHEFKVVTAQNTSQVKMTDRTNLYFYFSPEVEIVWLLLLLLLFFTKDNRTALIIERTRRAIT